MPEDAKGRSVGYPGQGSKSGAISFDLIDVEPAMQRSSESIGACWCAAKARPN
jgi:hypothetical protein